MTFLCADQHHVTNIFDIFSFFELNRRDADPKEQPEMTSSTVYNFSRSTSIDSIANLHDWTSTVLGSPVSGRRLFDWGRGSGNDLTIDPLFSPASSRQSSNSCPSPTPSQLSQTIQTPLLRVRNSLTDRPSLIVSSNIGRRIKGGRTTIGECMFNIVIIVIFLSLFRPYSSYSIVLIY